MNQSPLLWRTAICRDYSDPNTDSPYTIPLTSEEVDEIYAMENDLESDIESIVPQTLQDAMMDFILTGLQRHVSRNREKR